MAAAVDPPVGGGGLSLFATGRDFALGLGMSGFVGDGGWGGSFALRGGALEFGDVYHHDRHGYFAPEGRVLRRIVDVPLYGMLLRPHISVGAGFRMGVGPKVPGAPELPPGQSPGAFSGYGVAEVGITCLSTGPFPGFAQISAGSILERWQGQWDASPSLTLSGGLTFR